MLREGERQNGSTRCRFSQPSLNVLENEHLPFNNIKFTTMPRERVMHVSKFSFFIIFYLFLKKNLIIKIVYNAKRGR